ncbi:NAD(P)-binding protein [Piedraia hortae CBS 480.64]|uniref:NAD(P)-binding protein n=1 Tax=Piedraia hortae CBS 480.64 TaxID=1314780 RepID=A0A6A7BYX9_9PEZI|nr:NAD(P)-binding protein [Piedraia hortae CBS 480.64]
MSTSREDLSSRTLPFMTLSDGSTTAPPAPFPPSMTPTQRATERFKVHGGVIITGGAGTLGLSCARSMLDHGASSIYLWDLASTLQTSSSSISELTTSFPDRIIKSVPVDVTDEDAVSRALSESGGEISHLFCFAGVVSCVPAMEIGIKEWRRVIEINATGAFICARAIARYITERDGRGQNPSHTEPNSRNDGSRSDSTHGEATREYKATDSAPQSVPPPGGRSITLIASISAHRVNFPQPQVAYNVSKTSILALKSSLAAEWAHLGIRVNSISPGYMDTVLNAGGGTIARARDIWAERNPMGRMGAVGELDGVCVLLASRAGSYIQGADLVVDGGGVVF